MTEYYATIKKRMRLCHLRPWMDLESITLSEISQTEKENTIIPLINGI